MTNTQNILVAGIDEVGYGPLLGPLVVSSSIFLVKENSNLDLWARLTESTGKYKKGLNGRLLVTDSKKAYKGEYLRRSKVKVNHLERTVRAFFDQLHLVHKQTSPIILSIIANDLKQQFETYPWYRQLYNEFSETYRDRHTVDNLTTNMKQEEINFIDFQSVCIDVNEFNRMVRSFNNKATVVIHSILRLLRQLHVMAHFCNVQKIIVFCDKLGGRTYYGDILRDLPSFVIKKSEESNRISKYELSTGKIDMNIQFEVGADDKHFPVALSSLVGKYIREKLMQYMNDYFVNLQPGLKPTAGYWVDGHRFLRDLEQQDTLKRAGIKSADFVRIR